MAAASYNSDSLGDGQDVDDEYELTQTSDIECFDDDEDEYLNDHNHHQLARKRRRSSLAKGGKRSLAANNKEAQRKSGRKSVQLNAPPMQAPAAASSRVNSEIALARRHLAERVDQICEFVHVFLHCLLYKINYYDKKTHFEKLLKYNIIVYKCKSDIVCEYITNCVECFRLLLYKSYNLNEPSQEATKLGKSRSSTIALAILKNDSDEDSASNMLIKRYTIHIESLADADLNDSDGQDDDGEDEEASKSSGLSNRMQNEFRDSILKCLYAKDINYTTSSFKWQIQLRSSSQKMNELSDQEDLFKLFAWRHCDKEEITSITDSQLGTQLFTRSSKGNHMCVRPVKTLTSLEKSCKLRLQLFIEKPQKSMNNA